MLGNTFLLAEADLEQQIVSLGVRTVVMASIALVVLLIIAALLKDRVPKLKLPLFVAIAFTLIGTTLTLFGSTVYLNMKAESGGPVHWHNEIEFWSCGAELELRNPQGTLTNKIGTATFHEHNDKHFHLEGVVVRKARDASLKKFMEVSGGYATENAMAVPLNKDSNEWFAHDEKIDGDEQRTERFANATGDKDWVEQTEKGPVAVLKDGQYCSASDSAPAELQTFVYTYNKEDDTYTQRKLNDPSEYVMREESSLGPPADCVIVEFDTPRAATDKLCQQYGVRDLSRCTEFGVEQFDAKTCYAREINKPTGGEL